MAILRGIDGKFYEVPDDQVASFEVPRDKVKELLEKAGGPGPQGGPGQGPGGPGGYQGGPPPSSPIIVQIFGGSSGPGGPGGPGGPSGPPPGEAPQGDGDVHPYWWWRNFWPNWGNGWPNWGNY